MPHLTVRDCSFHYREPGAGAGAPLVWGHGLTGSVGLGAAYPLVDLSAVTRPVMSYDARGHGLSGDLTDPAQGSWAELSADQVGLIDALGYDRVALGGVSMGAGTAMFSALALRDRVEAMVLVIPPTGWDERAAQVQMYDQMAGVTERRGPKALLAAGNMLPPPDPFVGTTDWADRRAGTLGGMIPERLAAMFRGAGHADLPALDELASLKIRTLVLAWSGDPGHPVSTAERLGDTLPNVDVHVASTGSEFAGWSDKIADFLS